MPVSEREREREREREVSKEEHLSILEVKSDNAFESDQYSHLQ